VRDRLEAAGVDVRPAIELDKYRGEHFAVGLGMSILPDMAARERDRDLIMRPLDPPLKPTFALLQRCEARQSGAEDRA
jgi:hypothetical protein